MLPDMDVDALNDAMAESNRRARRGRAIARLMFILAVGLAAFLVAFLVYFVFLAPPQCMCPMSGTSPEAFGPPIGVIIMMVGFVGSATGLFWMWRILRADPDPDARSWRHRHRP